MNKSPIIVKSRRSEVCRGERGVALILTLLVTIILSVVVLEFSYLMRVHATLSGNLVDELQAEAAANAAMETAVARLLNDIEADTKKGIAADTLEEDWSKEVEFNIQSSAARAMVTDETAKLNLNRLVKRPAGELEIESTNMEMVESVMRLFESLKIEPNLVDEIVDWIDANDEEEPFGAEDAYYKALNPPIRCKNGPLDSIEELLFMEGFDKKMLYGEGDTPGLSEFVTVCGDEEGRVNINTAPEEVIAAIVNSESSASMIVDTRKGAPFESAEDMATRLPDMNLSDKFTTQSSFFLVVSEGAPRSPDSAEGQDEGASARGVKLTALLKRIKGEKQSEDGYFSIGTAYWRKQVR